MAPTLNEALQGAAAVGAFGFVMIRIGAARALAEALGAQDAISALVTLFGLGLMTVAALAAIAPYIWPDVFAPMPRMERQVWNVWCLAVSLCGAQMISLWDTRR